MPNSWKPEFLVQGEWATNAQRFATEAEAKASAARRFQHWTVPTDFRAAPSDDPPNYRHTEDDSDVTLDVTSGKT